MDCREAEIEYAWTEAILLRRPVLLEVAERCKGGDITMRRASAEPDLAAELADAEERPARAEGSKDGEPTLERLGIRRLGRYVLDSRTPS
jgi:hypothetical protein